MILKLRRLKYGRDKAGKVLKIQDNDVVHQSMSVSPLSQTFPEWLRFRLMPSLNLGKHPCPIPKIEDASTERRAYVILVF